MQRFRIIRGCPYLFTLLFYIVYYIRRTPTGKNGSSVILLFSVELLIHVQFTPQTILLKAIHYILHFFSRYLSWFYLFNDNFDEPLSFKTWFGISYICDNVKIIIRNIINYLFFKFTSSKSNILKAKEFIVMVIKLSNFQNCFCWQE